MNKRLEVIKMLKAGANLMCLNRSLGVTSIFSGDIVKIMYLAILFTFTGVSEVCGLNPKFEKMTVHYVQFGGQDKTFWIETTDGEKSYLEKHIPSPRAIQLAVNCVYDEKLPAREWTNNWGASWLLDVNVFN